MTLNRGYSQILIGGFGRFLGSQFFVAHCSKYKLPYADSNPSRTLSQLLSS
jgi:hypothetical protein